MFLRNLLVLFAIFFATVAFCQKAPKTAQAEFLNADGRKIGAATLTSAEGGARISVEVSQLSPGMHAIHIHSVGTCDRPDFTSAGAHFNPEGMMHGLNNAKGPHAGDLQNIEAGQDGRAHTTIFAARVTLSFGSNSLFHQGGTSIVIHEKADDYKTDPTGNSGSRVACGVIRK